MEKRCLCDRLLCFSIKKIGLFVVFTTFSSLPTLFYIISTENYIILEIIQLHFNQILYMVTYYNSMFNTRPPPAFLLSTAKSAILLPKTSSKKRRTPAMLLRLASYFRPYKKLLALDLFCAFL